MLEDVSARTVHAVLHSVREISGKQYDHLLEHAGWARFRAGIPPVSDELIATRTELESLFANVYALLGESLTRLFLRNYGRLLAMHLPSKSTLQAAAAALPPGQRTAWFIEAMIQMSTRNWTPATRSEDAGACYITFERCPLCTGAQGTHRPICATMETLYGQLAFDLLGHRLRVVEVECAASGAPHCKVALYK